MDNCRLASAIASLKVSEILRNPAVIGATFRISFSESQTPYCQVVHDDSSRPEAKQV
jgi:hypothetical protein